MFDKKVLFAAVTVHALIGLSALVEVANAEDRNAAFNTDPMPATASEYARMCSSHVGVTPTMNCADGVAIPIYVDGEEVFEHQKPGRCDHFDFKKTCSIGSKVGRLTGRDDQGNLLPDVEWVYFCRSTGPLGARYSSAQMIGHNRNTGATCFFEQGKQQDYFSFDERGMLEGEFPGPEDPAFDTVFIPPPVQCVECHEANPFIHNPWISGARLPGDPSQPVVPEIIGPNTPYFVVGGAEWNMRTVHIERNACLTCHRATAGIALLFEASGISVNEFMPPHAPGTMTEDYQELLACFKKGAAKTEGCDWIIPPASGEPSRIVHSDYEGKSALKFLLDFMKGDQKK